MQKTLLASVSDKLVDGLRVFFGKTHIDHASYTDLEIFLGWMLSRRVEGGAQITLVTAWKFGARYSIAPFQNEVMRRLLDILHSSPVDPSAVREAYYSMICFPPHTIDTKEALKLLRQAFVVQIAYQASNCAKHTLDKDKLAESKLQRVSDFQEDLTHAVCIGFYDEDPDMPGVQLDKHLVEE